MTKGVTIRLAGLLTLALTVLFVGVADAQGPGGFGKKGKGPGGPGGGGGSSGEIESLKNDVKALKDQMNRIESLLRASGKGGAPAPDDKKGPPFGRFGGFGKGDEKGGWGKWGGFEKKFGGKEPPMKKEEPKREPGRGPMGKGKGPDRGGDRGGDSRQIEQTIDRLIRELENLRRSLRR